MTDKQVMPQAEYVRLSLPHIKTMARQFGATGAEYADTNLVNLAAGAMQEKLAICRGKGRGGWWDENQCEIWHLKEMLNDHIQKGDMVDVMNIAAMIYVRECEEAG